MSAVLSSRCKAVIRQMIVIINLYSCPEKWAKWLTPRPCLPAWVDSTQLHSTQRSTWQFASMNNEAVMHRRSQFGVIQSVAGWHAHRKHFFFYLALHAKIYASSQLKWSAKCATALNPLDFKKPDSVLVSVQM